MINAPDLSLNEIHHIVSGIECVDIYSNHSLENEIKTNNSDKDKEGAKRREILLDDNFRRSKKYMYINSRYCSALSVTNSRYVLRLLLSMSVVAFKFIAYVSLHLVYWKRNGK